MQKHFQNVMLVGMASEISKNYTYTSVWIAQDTTESAMCISIVLSVSTL